MSANVWFEEVNTGLIAEILKSVKVTDLSGVVAPIGVESVFVKKPEEDFKDEVFPCVTIYNSTYDHNPLRYDPIPVKLGYSLDKRTIELEETAVPYDLSYQVHFWSRYQTDMDRMTRTWLIKHFRQFNLDVIDDGGVARSCNCLCAPKLIRSDLVLNKERLFHTIANLLIWVELDDETRYNMPVVITHEVQAKQKGESENG